MAKESDHSAGTRGSEKKSRLPWLLADENELDRRGLWRLGAWGAGAVAALTVAVLANQSSLGIRREQLAADLARQAEALRLLARDSQTETHRLASAIDTLNGDRDRLFSRVTVLEQGLDSVTGALARQNAAATAASTQPAAAKTEASAAKSEPSAAKPEASSAKPQAAAATAPIETQPSPTPPAQAAAPAPPAVGPVATTTATPPTERPRSEAVASPQARAPSPAPSASPLASDQASAGSGPALPKIASSAPAAAPATPLSAPNSLMGPPDPAASRLIEPPKPSASAALAGADVAAAAPSANEGDMGPDNAPAKVERTEFAVDLGSANSVGGLRALWRGLIKSNTELAALRPIIVVKERSSGLGMQLRLAAGPLMDAAAAAKICATLTESERPCETTVFDGQRLALRNDETEQPAAASPSKAVPVRNRHAVQKHSRNDDSPRPEPSALSALFGRK
jgi:hypothetical protein